MEQYIRKMDLEFEVLRLENEDLGNSDEKFQTVSDDGYSVM